MIFWSFLSDFIFWWWWQQRASEEFSERILILEEKNSRVEESEPTTGMLLIEKIISLNGFRDFERFRGLT